MQIGELSRRLRIPYRAVRYALERGHLDRWVRPTAGSGHHRELSDGESFCLGLHLKLKTMGFQAPRAEQVVLEAERSLRFMARAWGWDHSFDPFKGRFATGKLWILEIGDDYAFRLLTDANPSGGGKTEDFGWIDVSSRKKLDHFVPCVVIHINLSQLAELISSDSGSDVRRRSTRQTNKRARRAR